MSDIASIELREANDRIEELERQVAHLERLFDFCAKYVSAIRTTHDRFEIRLIDEPLAARLQGGKWYTGQTLKAAIEAAASDNEGERE